MRVAHPRRAGTVSGRRLGAGGGWPGPEGRGGRGGGQGRADDAGQSRPRAGPAPPPAQRCPRTPRGRAVGSGGLRRQGRMDLAVDLYLAVPLLFTVLAIVLASVFVRLRGDGGERAAERPREPAAEPAREGGPGGEAAGAAEGPEDEGSRVPVEEVGAGEEGKEAVAQQREAAAEPGPAAEPSPAAAESILRQAPPEPRQAPPEPRQASPESRPAPPEPRQAPPEPQQAPQEPHQPPPPEPRQPDHREDAESKIPPLGASPGSSLGHTGQAEDVCGHATLPSHAEEEEVDSENEKLVVREPEDEDAADETFSFKYSPGKLRGNQYKSMMSKEELEEEQRPEDYMKLSLASS
ncbi:matrix-remodeling-associated protein 7 isoform X3 [Myiozetetes cayanensis]|uniref:matrix-remodeling-associated protein 7 isoform X3 n=1 Tax=Myiozetetes cayanensis TaxID=478635 RepID=UPI002160E65E|nr:matrix-remodeling-associated protein 7 isoform X3 [Myiozetetes cayanensis]